MGNIWLTSLFFTLLFFLIWWSFRRDNKWWAELKKEKAMEEAAFARWRKERMAKYPDAPYVDLSYQRFCDETGRDYWG